MLANREIREKIYDAHLRNWQVSNSIGIADATFSRWLRTPLSDERKRRVEKAISDLTKVKE